MSIASINQGNLGRQPEDTGELMSRALHKILGIKSQENLTHYKLLGLDEDETDPSVIESAADKQMAHARVYQTSKEFGEPVQRILNRISNARVILLHAEKKAAYDETLRMRKTQQQTRDSIASVAPVAIPIASTDMPVVIGTAAGYKRAPSEQGMLQKYGAAIATGVTLTIAGIGATLWATSGSSKGSDKAPAAAKAELNPGNNGLPVKPVVTKTEQPDEIQPDFKDIVIDETPEIATFAEPDQAAKPGPAEETPFVAPPIAPNEIQLAQATEITPPVRVTTELAKPAAPLPPRQGLQDLLVADTGGPRADLRTVAVNDNEVTDIKKTLEDAEKGKTGGAQVDAILAWSKDPEMLKSPAAMKAIYELAFDKAFAARDIRRMKGIHQEMHSMPGIFTENHLDEREQHIVTALKDAANGKDMKRPDKAPERKMMVEELLSIGEKRALTNPNAALEIIPAARAAMGIQQRDVKADLDKRISSLETGIKKALENKALAEKEATEFARLNEALSLDPKNLENRKLRGAIHLSRGNAQGFLDDLSVSNHPKAALANDTLTILGNPSAASGKRSFDMAREWKDLANMTSNGRKATLQSIASKLFGISSTATIESLNPVEKKLAVKERDAVQAENVGGATAAVEIAATVESAPQWKSVMADIDVKKHSVSGDWSKNERGELTVKSAPNTRLVLPLKFPATRDYDVKMEFDVERTKGNNGVQIILPVGKGATVIINGWPERGGVTGITNINGADASKNEATVKGIVLPGGKHVLQVHVKKQGNAVGIAASVDGKQVLSWTGDVNVLTQNKDLALDAGQTGISTYNSEYSFSDVRILDAAEKKVNVAPNAPRVQTMKPVVEEKNTEPVKPDNVQKAEKLLKMVGSAVYNKETGGWYIVIPTEMDISQAVRTSSACGASLVVIDSAAENAFVNDIAPGKKVFLGIARGQDNNWYKPDGKQVTYTNWGRGEGVNNSERIAEMVEDGTWCDTTMADAKSVCLEFKGN